MAKIVRTISKDASVVASAIDALDIVSEIERFGSEGTLCGTGTYRVGRDR